jgi:hypothetical protein
LEAYKFKVVSQFVDIPPILLLPSSAFARDEKELKNGVLIAGPKE